MNRYSAWAVFKNGLSGHRNWTRQWRDPEPKKAYDVVIVGAGLHGLATAYYLAKNHGVRNIAVLEKGCVYVVPLMEALAATLGVTPPSYAPIT